MTARTAPLPRFKAAANIKSLKTDKPAKPIATETPINVDPYLKPGTVTTETLTFGDISLPPILSGIQPGQGLQGEAVDHHVKVIHISRRQIDWVLREIRAQHPDLDIVLQIVSRYMCSLDSVRGEARFGLACAKGWLRAEKPDLAKAMEQLDGVTEMLGDWHDEHRLHLR